jgi:hypothetical protein
MPQLTDSVHLVLLSEASVAMVDDAFTAVVDAIADPPKLYDAFLERRDAMIAGELPESLWLLGDPSGSVGWVGWAPYKERPHCWQTTTYFSAAHRGTGLFERARCHQVHAAEAVAAWASERGMPATFMLSIAAQNERSLAASRRYAASNGWPDTWERVFEPLADREAYVFTFPFPEVPHQCFHSPAATANTALAS